MSVKFSDLEFEPLKTFEEMGESEELCNWCQETEWGEYKSGSCPSQGYWFCEGTWCEVSYERYLDNYGVTDKLVSYQNNVKLINRGDFK